MHPITEKALTLPLSLPSKSKDIVDLIPFDIIKNHLMSFLSKQDADNFILRTNRDLRERYFYYLKKVEENNLYKNLHKFLSESLKKNNQISESEPDEKLINEITNRFKEHRKGKLNFLTFKEDRVHFNSSLTFRKWDKLDIRYLKNKDIFGFESVEEMEIYTYGKFFKCEIESEIKQIADGLNEKELKTFLIRLSKIIASSRVRKIFVSTFISKDKLNAVQIPLSVKLIATCEDLIEEGFHEEIFENEGLVVNILRIYKSIRKELFNEFLKKSIDLNVSWSFLRNENLKPEFLIEIVKYVISLPSNKKKTDFLYNAFDRFLELKIKEEFDFDVDEFFDSLSKLDKINLLEHIKQENIFSLTIENIFNAMKDFSYKERDSFLKKTMLTYCSFWEETLIKENLQEKAKEKYELEEGYGIVKNSLRSLDIGIRIEHLLAKITEAGRKESNELFMDLIDVLFLKKNIISRFDILDVVISGCFSSPESNKLLEDVLDHFVEKGHFEEAIGLAKNLRLKCMENGKRINKDLMRRLELRFKQRLREGPGNNPEKHKELRALYEQETSCSPCSIL